MSDPRPDPIELTRSLLRDVEPPTGASTRVRLGVEEATSRPRTARWPALVAGLAAACVALVLAARTLGPERPASGQPEPASAPSPPSIGPTSVAPAPRATTHASIPAGERQAVRVLAASDATLDDAALEVQAGSSIPHGGELRVGADGSARLAIERGVVEVAPGSIVVAREDGVLVRSGGAVLSGAGTLEAGPCRASVQDRGEVAWSEQVARFYVLASAETAGPPEVCVFERVLDAPDVGPRAPGAPAVRDSDLAAMMRAVEEARALRGHDDRAALARWRAIRRRWSGRGLDEEIDLYVVDALVGLGDHQAARLEAGRFLRRHPASAHRDRLRRIADGDEPP